MRIGILGGGQLGRMIALAGYPLGVRSTVFDPSFEPCAAEACSHIRGEFDDYQALYELVKVSDVVTFEFENVPVETARWLADRVPVYPPPRALEVSQERLAEKEFFASLGAYTAHLEAFDLFLLLVFGLLGLAMRRFALPVLPLILAVILGPLMETKAREALTISDGDLSGLFNEPLAVLVYGIIALLVVAPIVLHRLRPDLEPAALVPPEDASTTHDDWQEVDR